MTKELHFCVYIPARASRRMDLYFRSIFSNYSRSALQRFFEQWKVQVNGVITGKHAKVYRGDEIVFRIEEDTKLLPEDKPLDILYEDASFAVINKDPGVTVHPVPGEWWNEGTLVNRLLHHLSTLGAINGVVRPGIVHRLDRDTSGAIVIAKTNEFMSYFQRILADRKIEKTYLALVVGIPAHDTGFIESYIGRDPNDRKRMTAKDPLNPKLAQTRFRVVGVFQSAYALLELDLLTGRTHQIRVHLASIGFPIVGDAVYGNSTINKLFSEKYNLHRQALHAWKIGFSYEYKQRLFEAPLKEDMSFLSSVLPTTVEESHLED